MIDDRADAERLAHEAENMSQQLIYGAKREGVDTYTKTLLWHASDLIDRLNASRNANRNHLEEQAKEIGRQAAALAEKGRELREAQDKLARMTARWQASCEQGVEVERERDALLAQNCGQGHREPCTMCSEPINSLAGNPGLWPLRLGNGGWTHVGCVNKALRERDVARAEAQRLQEALDRCATAENNDECRRRAIIESASSRAFSSRAAQDASPPAPADLVERAREIYDKQIEPWQCNYSSMSYIDYRRRGINMLASALAAERADATRRERERPRLWMQWAEHTFGKIALDPHERTLRFIEEAIEVAHAMGLEIAIVRKSVDRVYANRAGETPREIGQAMACLECLAEVIGVDARAEATDELKRVQSIPQEEWNRRHAAKVTLGIALSDQPDTTEAK